MNIFQSRDYCIGETNLIQFSDNDFIDKIVFKKINQTFNFNKERRSRVGSVVVAGSVV